MTKREARRLIADSVRGAVNKLDRRLVLARVLFGIPETVRIMNASREEKCHGIVLVDIAKVAK
jgi:hypothetical protein